MQQNHIIGAKNCLDYNTTSFNTSISEVGMKTIPCDGEWNIILRHEDPTVSFHRSWSEYSDGFGDVGGDYYIGNQVR